MQVFAIVAVLGLTLAAAGSAERIVTPPLPGFVVGYKAANAEQSIREEVPTGQTVERWTRMVTTQWFAGLARRASPAVYVGNVIAGAPSSCPGARPGPVRSFTIDGRPAAQFRLDCPRMPSTGLPETFLFLAVAGQADMYVKQVAFRGSYKPADMDWGLKLLASVRFCAKASKVPACAG